jgi:hypothetical protein
VTQIGRFEGGQANLDSFVGEKTGFWVVMSGDEFSHSQTQCSRSQTEFFSFPN